ncbi:MAG: response regulator [Taibaiella sp.]|nr:response regulator [Taibaiella sp.]
MNFLDNFIIIDDDKLNNKLCTVILNKVYPSANIVSFHNPLAGFEYVNTTFAQSSVDHHAILLLDIMMPEMNAWAFLEEFDKLDELTKSRIRIYILSSSLDKSDMDRARANKYVEYYLIKPLTRESIKLMVHVLNKKLGWTPTN